jgi:hypothetical protein
MVAKHICTQTWDQGHLRNVVEISHKRGWAQSQGCAAKDHVKEHPRDGMQGNRSLLFEKASVKTASTIQAEMLPSMDIHLTVPNSPVMPWSRMVRQKRGNICRFQSDYQLACSYLSKHQGTTSSGFECNKWYHWSNPSRTQQAGILHEMYLILSWKRVVHGNLHCCQL